MENLVKLQQAIFSHEPTSELLDVCYNDLLDTFDLAHANTLHNLISMITPTERSEEILKVLDFIRFPVKKTFKVNTSTSNL